MGKLLRLGDGVMIPSNSVKLPGKKSVEKADRLLEVAEQMVDNNIYTERYRKKPPGEAQIKAQCNPLQIGQIPEIKLKTKTILLKIRLFYRPGESSSSIWQIKIQCLFSEDIDLGLDGLNHSHYSLVFGSSVEVDIDFKEVRDICFLKFFPTGAEDEVMENWCEEGPNRFLAVA